MIENKDKCVIVEFQRVFLLTSYYLWLVPKREKERQREREREREREYTYLLVKCVTPWTDDCEPSLASKG